MSIINGSNVRLNIIGIKFPKDYSLEIISANKNIYILKGYLCEDLGIKHYVDSFKKNVVVNIVYKDNIIINTDCVITECHLSFIVEKSATYKLVLEDNGTR